MATKKVTVTLGVEQVDEIKRRVASGDAASVSGFVQLAVERALDAEAAWDRELDRMLEESGVRSPTRSGRGRTPHSVSISLDAPSRERRRRPGCRRADRHRTATTTTVPLDRRAAGLVGVMLRRAGTKDVVDAHVVLCGLEAGAAIVTSDPDDLRRLDESVRLVEI